MLDSIYNWWYSPPAASSAPSGNIQAPRQLTDQQTAFVTQIFKNFPHSNCISMECRQCVPIQAGTGFATMNFLRFLTETTFLEVFENNIYLNTASWYGTPQWNGCIWFSGLQGSVNGLLSVTTGDPKKSHFYPLQGMSNDFIPTLVPACSKSGENGYACVFEDGIVELGVSLWDIDVTPKQLFRQAGFLTICFMDNRFLVGVDAKNRLACWDLETRMMRYSIDGWIENGETYPYFGPYFPKQNMLFASNGSWIYAFNLSERKLTYKFNLPVISGTGVFYMVPVGDKHIFFRELSCERLFVYEVSSGKQNASFQIGGGVDYIDTDDFPTCIYNGFIVALAEDRKTACFFDPANGKVAKTFGPTSEYITGLHCTKDRLIANCYCTTEVVPKGYRDQVYIWDISTGKELNIITPPEGYGISPQDITNGQLTIFLYPALQPQVRNADHLDVLKIDFTKDQIDKKSLRAKLAKSPLRKPLQGPQEDDFHWTDPNPWMLDDNKIRLQIWDTESCTLQKEINEAFKPSDDDTIFAKYESGRLTVDANSVILQNF